MSWFCFGSCVFFDFCLTYALVFCGAEMGKFITSSEKLHPVVLFCHLYRSSKVEAKTMLTILNEFFDIHFTFFKWQFTI